MSRIVETDFQSFAIKPTYILSFYFSGIDYVSLHAIYWGDSKGRIGCQGQWKIKYK